MITSLKIALRFLTRSKIQTLIIILSIAVGVSVQLFIGLLSKGLESTLLNKLVGNAAHITIYSAKGAIEDWEAIKEKVKVDPSIKVVCPQVEQQAYVKLSDMTEGVLVRGFIPEDMQYLYDMKNKIYKGKMVSSDKEVLIGKDLQERLGVEIGDKINIVTVWGAKDTFTVTGFYDFGAIKVNKTWVITNLKTAQELAGFGDKATSIELGVKEPYTADVISKNVVKLLGNPDLKVENWKDQNKLLLSGIMGQKICTVIIELFVLLAAVLSIISILGISVVQKYKQIGILKAMGVRDGTASLIFLFQAFILGVLGTALGVALIFIYIKLFNQYIITAEGTPVVDIIINKRFIKISALVDIGASTLAALFPAIKSFQLSPVEVIKNG